MTEKEFRLLDNIENDYAFYRRAYFNRDRQARYFLKKLIEARKALFALGWYEEDEQILPPTEFVFEPKRGK